MSGERNMIYLTKKFETILAKKCQACTCGLTSVFKASCTWNNSINKWIALFKAFMVHCFPLYVLRKSSVLHIYKKLNIDVNT